ncbi:non-specific serine,threonine protein kinase [Sarracenia purpurea var. burkii]
MGESPFSLPFIFFLFFFFFFFPFIFFINPIACSCPIDFDYVETFPWDTSLCRRQPADSGCCQTLLSIFAVGLSRHLKQTSTFYLPTAAAASSCVSDFQTHLAAVSIPKNIASQCLGDSSQFVVNRSSCAGIVTTRDWIEKVGPRSVLESSCNGDLTGLTRCSLCLDAGLSVNAQLVSLDRNSTKCFYYAVLYAAGVVNEYGPEDARTAACILAVPLSSSANRKPFSHLSEESLYKVVFGSIGALVGVLAAMGVIVVYRKKKNEMKKKKKEDLHEEYVTGVKARVLPNCGAKWFSLAELEKATNGFPQRNLIGRGGFGIVHRGILSDGTVVAVKQILDLDSKGDEEFINEVEIISKIRHRNLLSLRGCCVTSDASRGRRRYLVYDFMPNGSLNDHLFISGPNDDRKLPLNWPQRKNIILDVAKGLDYLHYGIKPAIFHRDIKPTNILLDSEFRATVADFGLARQSNDGESHLTTRVAGTHGYLAPEYALYGQLTEKSDVYSFGILVLEIMSGRKALNTAAEPSAAAVGEVLIADWAWTLVKLGKTEEVLEEIVREEGPRGVVERYVLVGILCAHVMVALRPTVADALRMLEGDIEIPRIPDRPLPLAHESFRSSFRYSASATRECSRGSSIIGSM